MALYTNLFTLETGNNIQTARGNFTSQIYQQGQSRQYDLNLILRQERLQVLLTDEEKHCLLLRTYNFSNSAGTLITDKLEKIIEKEDYLQQTYRNIRFAFANNRCTIVPAAMYDPSAPDEYLKLHHYVKVNETILADPVTPEMKNIFAANEAILDFIKKKFPPVEIHHAVTPVLAQFLKQNEDKGPALLAHVQPQFFDIIAAEGNELKLFNSFSYTTKEDFVYFIVYVLEQLKMNSSQTEILFAGEVEENSALVALTKKYMAKVSFAPPVLNCEAAFTDPKHLYYNIMSFSLCG